MSEGRIPNTEDRPGDRLSWRPLGLSDATLADLRRANTAARQAKPEDATAEFSGGRPHPRRSRGVRFPRTPLVVLLLAFAALSNFSLILALRSALDDGSISFSDVVRLLIIAIIAGAFLYQLVMLVAAVTRLRSIVRSLLGRSGADRIPRPTTVIPSLAEEPLVGHEGLGAVGRLHRARFKSARRADDMFWVGLVIALVLFAGLSAYALGFGAIKDLSRGDAMLWATVRLVLLAAILTMVWRAGSSGLDELVHRRSRRRKRAIRRLLRYLLWWGHPTAQSTPRILGGMRFAGYSVIAGAGILAGGTAFTAAVASWAPEPSGGSVVAASDGEDDEGPGATETATPPRRRNGGYPGRRSHRDSGAGSGRRHGDHSGDGNSYSVIDCDAGRRGSRHHDGSRPDYTDSHSDCHWNPDGHSDAHSRWH